MPTVHFENVGRRKKSGSADIPLTEAAILKEIRRNGALMSRDIDFTLDLDTGEGSIYAGFHVVGRIRVPDPAAVEVSA